MDAGKMVERAENWRKVPQQKKCSIEYDGGKNMSKVERKFPSGKIAIVKKCMGFFLYGNL